MKIAALLDGTGQVAIPQRGGTLYIYEREGMNWVASQKLEFTPGEYVSMADLRRYLEQVRDWLGDCKVLAAGETTGYYRVLFGSLGIALWGVRGTPEQFIEQLETFHLQAETVSEPVEPEPVAAAIEPISERTGHYRLDLRAAMAQKGSHTSRQVLIPFFQNSSFLRLEIVCDHVPRWFDRELPEFGLGSKVESQSDFVKVHVYPLSTTKRSTPNASKELPGLGCQEVLRTSHLDSSACNHQRV
jgi:Fe-only nitrogenase accessory protein AnfO